MPTTVLTTNQYKIAKERYAALERRAEDLAAEKLMSEDEKKKSKLRRRIASIASEIIGLKERIQEYEKKST